MGTTYTVRIGNCAPVACERNIAPAIETRLQELENRFSHYQPDSELSRFNQHAATNWFPVSTELATLVQLAGDISQLSGGAFDITVAPAVNAWGFGPQNPMEIDPQPPDDAAVLRAKQTIGYQQLAVQITPPALKKTTPALTLDMSAIAKGYAVDQLAYLLEAAGFENFLVEIGGELRTAGTRPDGQNWRIAIEPPDLQRGIEFIVQPENNAVATSGDYRNYFEHHGIRYSHAINPANGRPVNDQLASVSVIAPSAAQADALATALMVMGTKSGMDLATRQNIAALFIERDGTQLKAQYSDAFTTYLLR
jgi:thiamine biosynthesis lipoprotein